MARITVKPLEGKRVPNPDTGVPLPAEGLEVDSNQYWFRRMRDGDVTEVKPTARKRSERRTQRSE